MSHQPTTDKDLVPNLHLFNICLFFLLKCLFHLYGIYTFSLIVYIIWFIAHPWKNSSTNHLPPPQTNEQRIGAKFTPSENFKFLIVKIFVLLLADVFLFGRMFDMSFGKTFNLHPLKNVAWDLQRNTLVVILSYFFSLAVCFI